MPMQPSQWPPAQQQQPAGQASAYPFAYPGQQPVYQQAPGAAPQPGAQAPPAAANPWAVNPANPAPAPAPTQQPTYPYPYQQPQQQAPQQPGAAPAYAPWSQQAQQPAAPQQQPVTAPAAPWQQQQPTPGQAPSAAPWAVSHAGPQQPAAPPAAAPAYPQQQPAYPQQQQQPAYPQQQPPASANAPGYPQPAAAAPTPAYAQPGVVGAAPTYAQPAAQPAYAQPPAQPGYAQPAAQPAYAQPAAPAPVYGAPATAAPPSARAWVGTVTQIIPPNYGVVDGDAFYIEQLVVPGSRVPKLGDRVRCDAIPEHNSQYKWRITRVYVDPSTPGAAGAIPPPRPPPGAPALGRAGIGAPGAPAGLSAAQRDRTTPPTSYNNAPPPTIAYTADVALAVAANAVESSKTEATTAVAGNTGAGGDAGGGKSVPYVKPPPQMSEEERKKAEEAVQQYSSQFGKGAALLSKMGFGTVAGFKGGLGAKGQGIAAPVDPKSTRNQIGLGFVADERPAHDSSRHRHSSGRGRRSRSPSRSRSRSRSGSDSDSSSRSRSRSRSPVRRYSCHPPKWPVGTEPLRGLAAVSKRYKDLYVPSDYCNVSCSWQEVLPDGLPLDLTQHVAVNIRKEGPASGSPGVGGDVASKHQDQANGGPTAMEEDTRQHEAPAKGSAVVSQQGTANLSAAKAERWGVRVVLMTGANPETLFTESGSKFKHPAESLSFLLLAKDGGEDKSHKDRDDRERKDSSKDKSRDRDSKQDSRSSGRKLSLICGQWRPSDGGSPSAPDAQALVNTAVRSVKEATGVDLSSYTDQVIRFAEIQYLRPGPSSKVPFEGTQVEHVVIFLAGLGPVAQPNTRAVTAAEQAKVALEEYAAGKQAEAEADAALKEVKEAVDAATAANSSVPLVDPTTGEDLRLEPNKLTVAQLQEEMAKRGLDTKWDPLKGKKVLVDRLQAHLDSRRTEQEQWEKESVQVREAQTQLAAATARHKEAKAAADAAYAAAKAAKQLLKEPVVPMCVEVVQSSTLVQKGTSLAVLPLDKLLQYSEDDSTEGHFEVSLFAELFSELLAVRFGRGLLRALQHIVSSKRSSTSSSVSNSRVGTSENKEGGGQKRTRDEAGGNDDGSNKLQEGQAQDASIQGATEAGQQEDASDNPQQPGGAEVKKEEEEQKVLGATRAADGAIGGEEEQQQAAKKVRLKEEEGQGGDGGRQEAPVQVKEEAQTAQEAAAPLAPAAKASPPPKDTLLLAARYFDVNCTGYLEGDDLEDILYMTCHTISRRQTQLLVDSVTDRRGRFSYMSHKGLHIPDPHSLN